MPNRKLTEFEKLQTPSCTVKEFFRLNRCGVLLEFDGELTESKMRQLLNWDSALDRNLTEEESNFVTYLGFFSKAFNLNQIDEELLSSLARKNWLVYKKILTNRKGNRDPNNPKFREDYWSVCPTYNGARTSLILGSGYYSSGVGYELDTEVE